MDEKELSQKKKTGTTTVGIKAMDSVVLAADQLAVLGYTAIDTNVSKIYSINKKVAVTIAGGVGDALTLIRFLRSHAKLFEIERENPMTPKSVMTLLANVLNSNRYYPFIAFFILGGYNNKPEIYSTDLVGGYNEVQKYTATGSGMDMALGFLEENYKENMQVEGAIETAVRAVNVARKRNIATGGESISVVVITKEGLRELPRKEVEKYLKTKETAK